MPVQSTVYNNQTWPIIYYNRPLIIFLNRNVFIETNSYLILVIIVKIECMIGNDKAVFVVLWIDHLPWSGRLRVRIPSGLTCFVVFCCCFFRFYFIIHNQLTIFPFIWVLYHDFYIHLASFKRHWKVINSYIILSMIHIENKDNVFICMSLIIVSIN